MKVLDSSSECCGYHRADEFALPMIAPRLDPPSSVCGTRRSPRRCLQVNAVTSGTCSFWRAGVALVCGFQSPLPEVCFHTLCSRLLLD